MLVGKNGEYVIGEIVASNDVYRVRTCRDGDGRELLFQVAVEEQSNSGVARSAWALAALKKAADEIEAQYAESGHKGELNYDLGFPQLHDSFLLTGQGNRQVNVLGFRGVESLLPVIPLVKIWKDSLRVDLRTSAWILGRLLKTVSFAHDNRLEVGRLTGGNILIEPDQHQAIVFDWSRVVVHDEAVPVSVRRKETQAIARVVLKALGGDLDRVCENEADLLYTGYLRQLVADGASDASGAHQALYEIIDTLCEDPTSVWEKGFYQFTTRRI